jgi:hypothetical protein
MDEDIAAIDLMEENALGGIVGPNPTLVSPAANSFAR